MRLIAVSQGCSKVLCLGSMWYLDTDCITDAKRSLLKKKMMMMMTTKKEV